MGKGYKRKTRWRTLNIADPPGEEDDEDGKRDSKTRENGTGKAQHNWSSHHKQMHSRNETRSENGVINGNSTRTASPSRAQPKIIFDENEYTRITTPRQDVLFKKGYLARKKMYSSNNASTSATPSTTESQSASHSTADGSETTEDHQLLDCRDTEEYPGSINGPSAGQMSYGTFYDPTTGYYYEYPVMVVGPPMPGPPMHNVLAGMPCEPVPLRTIEWVNPAFVPKLEQPYCLIDYQNTQVGQYPSAEETDSTLEANPSTNATELPVENGNGTWTPGEDNVDVGNNQEANDQPETTTTNQCPSSDTNFQSEPCLETVLAQQLHVSHHVVPPQPYMYPGHYMFGPALINVNGMTLQSGPMVRTIDIAAGSAIAKRRKKKKMMRRRLRRPNGQDNNGQYAPEEEYCSSEADNNTHNCQFQPASIPSSRPLNPDCKEFQLRPLPTTIAEVSLSSSPTTNGNATLSPQEDEKELSEPKICRGSPEDSQADSTLTATDVEYATEAIATEETHIENGQETEVGVDVTCPEFKDIVEASKDLSNGLSSPSKELSETIATNGVEDEIQLLSNGISDLSPSSPERRETIQLSVLSSSKVKKKYKTNKIVREPTPGPETEDETISPAKPDSIEIDVIMGVEAVEAPQSSISTISSYDKVNDGSNDDSGFESQHPITEAVTQWLRRANSPDLFIGLRPNDDNSDKEEDDIEPDDHEPSKNLQGNPMPALSANSVASSVKITLPRPAGEITSKRRKRSSNKRKNQRVRQTKQLNKCEFTCEDSVAGMRVAESTQIDVEEKENEVNDKTTNQSIQSSRDHKVEVMNNFSAVKTYEQGEIVVTIDGKFIPTTINSGFNRDNDTEDSTERKSEINSLGSIEEPDVLEYWDVETVEPVRPIVPKNIQHLVTNTKQDIDPIGLEIVRKYYKFARNSIQSGSSNLEYEIESKSHSQSRLTSPDVIKEFEDRVDEGIEIYESYYGGKYPPIYFNSNQFKSSKFYMDGQERPIPCRTTCCNVQ